ncbi:RmlC-like cupin [Lophiostoma macrostomum CBS 122681]|uniref:RmlC-like cupin n=1 Tax=Lophiostoma macrostomum CBS 122681 TaxID=1314788 RepID=A0A6A6T8R1_9PLEO|nr:RmlC-like cupin [Lophiostoma macrostomum CBS 122681]
MIRFFLSLFFFGAALAVDKTSNPDLSGRLKMATTNLDRHGILSSNDDWTFHYDKQDGYTFRPGSVVNANAATFPAMTGVGMTLTMLNLGPCAMLPPHSHPRATNLVVAVKGNTTSYMIGENGVGTVEVNLQPNVMTIFPAGSLHAMQNNGCEDAQLVSALNSDDTGTLNALNGLYQLPPDILKAAFGYVDMDIQSMGKSVPDVGTGSVKGSDECFKRCGLSH